MQLELQTFNIGEASITLYVPHAEALQAQYRLKLMEDPSAKAPYWSKVWPAATGLILFLQSNLDIIAGKKVLEIAGGLGLPSLYAARIATSVYCTDAEEDAVQCVMASIEHLQLTNMKTGLFNWHRDDALPAAEVLLLSDINYDPADFERILTMLQHYLQQGTTIILATPQRLMAKPLIASLLLFAVMQENMQVTHAGEQADITVYILQQ